MPKPQTDQFSDKLPYAIRMGKMTFNTPAEAHAHFNRMSGVPEEIEANRQRFEELLSERIGDINQRIRRAVEEAKKTKRITTKGRQIGMIDILRPLISEGIIRMVRNGNQRSYEANPDIENAEYLAEIATARTKAIEEKLKEDYEKRQARREAYKATAEAENGFEQTITREGKDIAQFAYQIEIKQIPGANIKQIIIQEVVIKFGLIKIRKGNVFIYGDRKTPLYLDKAADELEEKQLESYESVLSEENGFNAKFNGIECAYQIEVRDSDKHGGHRQIRVKNLTPKELISFDQLKSIKEKFENKIHIPGIGAPEFLIVTAEKYMEKLASKKAAEEAKKRKTAKGPVKNTISNEEAAEKLLEAVGLKTIKMETKELSEAIRKNPELKIINQFLGAFACKQTRIAGADLTLEEIEEIIRLALNIKDSPSEKTPKNLAGLVNLDLSVSSLSAIAKDLHKMFDEVKKEKAA